MNILKNLSNRDYKFHRLLKSILLLCLCFNCFILQAQFVGWPINSGPISTPEDALTKDVTTTEYTDINRVQVTASNQISWTPDQYELDVSAPNGGSLGALSFPKGKWCLIIQMEDNTNTMVGQHCRVEVISFNSSTGKLVVEVPTGNAYPAFTFATDARVQLIRVPVWRTINLEPQGELTCQPYNHADGTGGIVALVAGSILNFKGGIINASAKGYHVGGNYTLGTGGAGQTPTPFWVGGLGYPYGPHPYAHNSIPGGNPPPIGFNPADNGYMCSYNASANPPMDFDLSGHANAQYGGNADNNFIAGLSTWGAIERYFPATPANSTLWTALLMGNSGDPGINGGHGAGGGGYGGQGGDNSAGFGTAGVIGQIGEQGGDVGDASRGGGIVLLKINNFSKASTITATRKMIYADGQNGRYGTNGGKGGEGGEGGIGSIGDCVGSKISPPGSIGGYGQSGKGAKGGDGGAGGECGAVWIMKRTTGSLSGHVSLAGGKGGTGGAGGYSKAYLGLPLANNWNAPGLASMLCNLKDYYMCYPYYSCPDYEICDCDKVFEKLSDINTGYTVTNSTMPNHIDKPGFERVYYTDDFNNDGTMIKALYYNDVSGPCPVKYKCIMARQELYQKMLEKLYKTRDLQTYFPSTGSNYKVGANTISTNSAGNVELNFVDASGNWKVLEYRPGDDELEDKDDPNRPIVYAWNCDFTYPEGFSYGGGGGGGGETPIKKPEVKFIKTGDPGNTGGDEPDGGGNPDYYGEDDNAPLIAKKPLHETMDLVSVSNLPQVGNSTIVEVELIAKTKVANYLLYDMSGRLIEKGLIEGIKQFSGFVKGIYTLVIKTDDASDIKKLQF